MCSWDIAFSMHTAGLIIGMRVSRTTRREHVDVLCVGFVALGLSRTEISPWKRRGGREHFHSVDKGQ